MKISLKSENSLDHFLCRVSEIKKIRMLKQQLLQLTDVAN